jgi:hypothetical protein
VPERRDRVGCALTTCGTGPMSEHPWAVLRGNEWRAPLALAQVIVLAVALTVAAETFRMRGATFVTMLAGLVLAEVVAVPAGRTSAESAVALGVLAVSYASSWGYSRVAAVKDAGHPGNNGARAR